MAQRWIWQAKEEVRGFGWPTIFILQVSWALDPIAGTGKKIVAK
jgi:hypothetical protein